MREHYDSNASFNRELWESVVELGFGGTCIPAEHGGSELGLLEAALIAEEFGRHTAPLFLEGHTLAGLAIARGGSVDQQERLLTELATGQRIATLAVANIDDEFNWCHWHINPEEDQGRTTVPFVPNADVADLFILGCSRNRIGALEKSKTNIDVTHSGGIDQSRQIFEISFDASAVEIIPDFSGEQLCDALITLLAADAFGAAQKMIEMTTAYAMEREQFGQPIAQFQAVKHQLANFALGAVTARGLFWKAALEFDANHRNASRSASMAKAHICDQAFEIGRGAVELHGGIGITWESDLQFYFKRAMFDRNYMGTPDMHWARCADLAGWNQ